MNKLHGGIQRPYGGRMSRFVGTSHHADRERAALREDHPAIVNSTTLFPKSVKTPTKTPSLLVSGYNNAKIGAKVTKGPWAGAAIYTLSLVERETCPSTCPTWRECYGNAMPFARRHRPDDRLTPRLKRELETLIRKYGKIAVRLHVLGDFFSEDYVRSWWFWLDSMPELHIWGYTAHPKNSPIGKVIQDLNADWPERCAIRFSHSPDQEMSAGVIWRQPENHLVPEGWVCPASMEKTATCGTCGLCWAAEKRDSRVIFPGHGMKSGRKKAT